MHFHTPTGTGRPALSEPLERRVMLIAAGDLDPSFGNAGAIYDYRDSTRFHALVAQTDGKILAGGTISRADGSQDFLLERYSSFGQLDTTFGSAGRVVTDIAGGSDEITALALQSDGSIIAVGSGTAKADGLDHVAVTRYTPAGQLDSAFAVNGRAIGELAAFQVEDVLVLPDDRIVVSWQNKDYRTVRRDWVSLVRYTANGTLDESFAFTSHAVLSNGYFQGSAIALQPDGKIVVVGGDAQFTAVRVNSDGSLDLSFGSNGLVTLPLPRLTTAAVTLQPDGKIVVGASYRQYDWSAPDLAFARLNSNGSQDFLAYPSTVSGQGDYVSELDITADGKILAAGRYTHVFAVRRFTSSGAIDKTFGNAGEARNSLGPAFGWNNSTAYAMSVLADGRILATGFVGLAEDTSQRLIARWNGDGSVDNTFGSSGIATDNFARSVGEANSIAIQSDGKIVTAGFAIGPAANDDFAITRRLPDGSPDTSFAPAGIHLEDFLGGSDRASDVIIQPDGKILAAGSASSSIGSTKFAMLRLLPDGSPDPQFGVGGKVVNDDFVSHIALQSDGKIIGVGYNYTSGGMWLRRYNANGQPDLGFGSNGFVAIPYVQNEQILTLPDGRILVGGTYGNLGRDFGLIRFNADGTLDSTFGGTGIVSVNRFVGIDPPWPSDEFLYAMAVAHDGSIYAGGEGNAIGALVIHVLANGTFDTSFGTNGFARPPMASVKGLLIEPGSSKVLVIGQDYYPHSIAVARMTADGSIDAAFGDMGLTTFKLGHQEYGRDQALQPDGKLVIAGVTLDSPLLLRMETQPPKPVTFNLTQHSFYVLRRDAAQPILQIFTSALTTGAPQYVAPLADITSFVIAPAGPYSGRLTIDYSNGDPIPAVGLTYRGVAEYDTFTINATPVNPIHIDLGGGNNVIAIAGGNVKFDPAWIAETTTAALEVQNDAALLVSDSLRLSSLNVRDRASVRIEPATGAILRTGSLTISPSAFVDLADSAAIIDYSSPSPIAGIRAHLASGRGGTDFANASWTAPGMNSSSAAAHDGISFALGYLENSSLPSLGLPSYTAFLGQTVDSTAILIRYTLGADANLDGRVNSVDAAIINANFNTPLTGHWFRGDFDYDGPCDTDDVTVIGALYDPTAPALAHASATAFLSNPTKDNSPKLQNNSLIDEVISPQQ